MTPETTARSERGPGWGLRLLALLALLAPQLRRFAVFLPASVLAIGAFGLVRLERQFPAAASSPGLLVPFVLPVLSLALEAGALVALSAAQLGVLSIRDVPGMLTRARLTAPLLGLLLLVVGGAELIPRGTEHPGAFANELVRTARSSCGHASTVPVPLLGLSVSCHQPSRIEGPMPGVASVQVAMRELTFSDDLRRVEISGLELTAKRALVVHLSAAHANIAGLAPWSRSPRLSLMARFATLAALGAALWFAASLLWRKRSQPAASDSTRADQVVAPARLWLRLLGGVLLAMPGAIVAGGFISLDQERAPPLAYAGAAFVGVLALWLLGLLRQRLPRIFNSFRGF